jgi:hypothetical protein
MEKAAKEKALGSIALLTSSLHGCQPPLSLTNIFKTLLFMDSALEEGCIAISSRRIKEAGKVSAFR